jgi:hypothetical protein
MNLLGRTAVFEDQRDGFLGKRGRRELRLGRGWLGTIWPWGIGLGRQRSVLIGLWRFVRPVILIRLRSSGIGVRL